MRALYIVDTLNNDVNLQAYYSLYKKERKKLNRQERKKALSFFSFSILAHSTQYYGSLSALGRDEKDGKRKH